MERLSSRLGDMRPRYAVVVVGSGYGGAIAASRLSRANQRVCVLERGKELRPGEYPCTPREALGALQVELPNGDPVGDKTGLYRIVAGCDINVITGCGLGGTSLINANVALRPEPWVFDDPAWPKALRDEGMTLLEKGFALAARMLGSTPYPTSYPPLPKLTALEASARRVGGSFSRPPINVTFADGTNEAGVFQSKCTLCGDCCSGCNVGAKNSVLMNYLPDARAHGAELFTEVDVRYVEKRPDGRFRVWFDFCGLERELFEETPSFVEADVVVLAGGTVGSTEILLRSKEKGLPLSDTVGRRFSANGDVLAFSYNGDRPVDAVGSGPMPPGVHGVAGPCITGLIDRRRPQNGGDPREGFVVEDGVIPGALAPLLPAMFSAAAALGTNTAVGDAIEQELRQVESRVLGPHRGAVKNTQTFLVMSHDDAGGTISLGGDRPLVTWPGIGEQPHFRRMDDVLVGAASAERAILVRNPEWNRWTGGPLVTVHPLGGCVMADDAARGVVNDRGEVFAGSRGDGVHSGLYVADGSIVPMSLGVNPLLTISALAERACMLLAQDRGWTIDYTPAKAAAPSPGPATPPGLRFTERMSGPMSRSVTTDYAAAEAAGARDKTSLEFLLTIVSDDLPKMLDEAPHEARMVGTVVAPALSAAPLAVSDARFNLFIDDGEEAATRRMVYRMRLASVEGRRYFFHGFKRIRHGNALDAWPDTSTLYVTLYEGDDENGPVAAKAVLRIAPVDFAKQLTTMEVTGAKDLADRLRWTERFGRFFAGVLFAYYGGVVSPPRLVDASAPLRRKRPLRASTPSLHPIQASDGTGLLLTRYRPDVGERPLKGPVLLSHGLGVSSRIFSTDAIDTNLVEYLCAHDYDVWLLDYRSSIDLPASATQYSGDDVATKDYPAAVAAVRELTGRPSVQMVVHCYGSTTFVMAMAAGLQGVRSAVCSQIAAHFEVPPLVGAKSLLHAPDLLDVLGFDALTAYAASNEGLLSRIYDRALALYPVGHDQHCDSATCHRISFMYSLLYQHQKLNELTHDVLHELFGLATAGAFRGLARMIRAKHVVDARGKDVYLPNLGRLAVPTLFIHGEQNQCFLPASTEKTMAELARLNGPGLYSRRTIPGYGHIDCIFGRDAAVDVFPHMLAHLELTAVPS